MISTPFLPCLKAFCLSVAEGFGLLGFDDDDASSEGSCRGSSEGSCRTGAAWSRPWCGMVTGSAAAWSQVPCGMDWTAGVTPSLRSDPVGSVGCRPVASSSDHAADCGLVISAAVMFRKYVRLDQRPGPIGLGTFRTSPSVSSFFNWRWMVSRLCSVSFFRVSWPGQQQPVSSA